MEVPRVGFKLPVMLSSNSASYCTQATQISYDLEDDAFLFKSFERHINESRTTPTRAVSLDSHGLFTNQVLQRSRIVADRTALKHRKSEPGAKEFFFKPPSVKLEALQIFGEQPKRNLSRGFYPATSLKTSKACSYIRRKRKLYVHRFPEIPSTFNATPKPIVFRRRSPANLQHYK